MLWVRDTAHDLWQLANPVRRGESSQEPLKWKKPEPGWIKVNTDAAFQVTDFSGATACIARDDQGQFRVAQARWYDRGLDVCMLEALACRDGMQLALQNGVRRVAIETDCLQLINLWKKKDVQRSNLGPILEMDALSLAFQAFSFNYVSRACNNVAHVLAKQVSNTHRTEMWHVTPACVLQLLASEASPG
jgi:ribonuclease HI